MCYYGFTTQSERVDDTKTGGERVLDPNSVAETNRDTYNAWQSYWLSKGKTLADAVEYGRQQGGDAYAEKLKRLIEQMEAPAI